MIVLGIVSLRVTEDESPTVAVVEDVDIDVDNIEANALADVDVVAVNGCLEISLVEVLRIDDHVTIPFQRVVAALKDTLHGLKEIWVIVPVAQLIRGIMLIVNDIEVRGRCDN